MKTKRKKKRTRVGTVDGLPMNHKLRAAFEAEGLLPPRGSRVAPCVTVNRVGCSTDPGGYSVTPIAVQPGQEV